MPHVTTSGRRSAVRGAAATVLTAAALVASVLVTSASASAPARANRLRASRAKGLASVLRSDGSIRSGRSGSFDAHGFRMTLAANGAPRLVRTTPADANWDDRFGEPGVTNDIFGAAVNALAVDGTDVYVGGIFTFAGGARHSYVLRWDGRSWHDLSGGIAGAPSNEDPEVDALALSGDTLYVGGIFNSVRNGSTSVTANGVAAWNTQTETWSALGTGVSAGDSCEFCVVRVAALAASGSTLYAAGSFGRAGSTDVNSIARWNGSSWSALGAGLWSCEFCEPVQPGDVHALLLSGSTLYAGGIFESAGTVVANNIAQWNTGTSTWSALGDGVSTDFFSSEVDALALNGSNLIAGGDFTHAGSVNVNSIAVWTGSAWQAIDGTNSGVVKSGDEGVVDALLVDGGTLFVGGSFDHLQPGGTATKGGLTSFNLGSPGWTVLPMQGDVATVNAFAADPGGGVVVGGAFDTGGPIVSALVLNNIGVLNGTTWSTLGQGVTYGEDGHGFGLALAHNAAGEYVGGWFDQTGPIQTTGVSRWDGSVWHAMGTGIAGGSGATGPMVFAIAVVKSQVFIGGEFDSVDGVTAHNIAVYSGGAWHAVGGGTDGIVQGLAASGGYLYAGGAFDRAGGKLVGAPAARWKLGTALTSAAGWHKLGPAFGSGGVEAFAFAGPWVILGGDLGHCEQGSPCDHGGTGHDTAPCEAQSGFSVNGLIMWKTTTPNSWYAPFGCGVTVGAGRAAAPGDVKTLRKVGTTLYVGGFFDHAGVLHRSANQIAANNVVALDLKVLNTAKTTWKALKTGAGLDRNGESVNSLSSSGNTLYVGGEFLKAGGLTAHGVARWNIGSSTWSTLGSGLACPDDTCTGAYANAVDAGPAGVYFAGEFGTAGAKGSDNIALWHPPA